MFRAPPAAQIAWALVDDDHRRVLELCQGIARDKTLARLEKSVAQIRWGSGGKHRAPVKDGLIVAVFRHYESRAGKPLLPGHAVVSIKARRSDGKWGNVSDPVCEQCQGPATPFVPPGRAQSWPAPRPCISRQPATAPGSQSLRTP